MMGAAILLIPAAINGFPFWFYDTLEYHQLGQSIVTHVADVLAPAQAAPETASPAAPTADAPAADDNGSLTYVGGRSPVYGLLVYLSSALASYWLVAIVQALVAAWLLSAVLRAAGLRGVREYLITIAAAAALTALPFFSAELMPDVWTGFAFLAIALIFLGGAAIGVVERAALVLVIAFAAVSHQTNLALGLGLIVLALVAGWALRLPMRSMLKRAGVAGLGLAMAFGANAAYALVTKAMRGEAPGNPPYLMARVLVDGPGQLYLRDVCTPTPRFEICRYADRPFNDVNDFLWQTDPRKGVYMLADIEGRRRLMAEERAFVLGAVTHYPAEQLAASGAHTLSQLTRTGVRPELELSRQAWVELNWGALAPRDDAAARASLAFREVFPFGVIDTFDGAIVIIALLFLAWRLTRRDVVGAFASSGDGADMRKALAVAALCLAAWLLANAFLCGAFSGVFDRYQARTIWLVPLLALLVYFSIGPAFALKSLDKRA